MNHSCIPFRLSMLSLACLSVSSFTALANNEQSQAAETIEVIGKKHHNSQAPSGKSEFIDFSQFSPNVVGLSEMIANTPGAELSGQGGLFQVYSLRGMSRWRVLTQFAGVPIHTERRAGTAASFISPWLMQQVEVVKGPVSTLYGSGGMAGISQITPRQFNGTYVQTSYGSDNHSQGQNFGWGNEQISFGLSRRKDQNGHTSSGALLNNHFEQLSGSLIANHNWNDSLSSQVLLLSSKGTDIGKTNNEDFINSKYTIYPDETHHLAQFALISTHDWQARLAFHKQALTTEVTRFDERINTVANKASDYSLSFLQRWQYQDLDGQWGYEQEYRDNIDAKETEQSLTAASELHYHVLAANQLNSALFANINYNYQQFAFTTGGRYSYIKQRSELATPEHNQKSDQAFTAFVSGAYRLDKYWRINASASSGFRFPTVTERFFSGTTARGTTLGNINLEPETALNLELGLSYQNPRQKLEVNWFNNRIEDYIERVNINDDVRSYQNLNKGTIQGAEFGFTYQLNDSFSYILSGHTLQGEDQDGKTLADISPNKLQLELNYQQHNWQAKVSVKHRFKQNEVADGDQPLAEVNIVNASLSYDLSDNWQLSLWGDNLLDKEYLITSDSKSAYSAERRYGIKIAYALE